MASSQVEKTPTTNALEEDEDEDEDGNENEDENEKEDGRYIHILNVASWAA